MVCIYCGNPTRIINSRPQKRTNGTWRRHACLSCGAVFTTTESADYNGSLSFKDQTSHIVPFDRERLFISVYEACKHRSSAVTDAASLCATIIQDTLRASDEPGLIDRRVLVETAAATLQRFDVAAYTYYTAYHRR